MYDIFMNKKVSIFPSQEYIVSLTLGIKLFARKQK